MLDFPGESDADFEDTYSFLEKPLSPTFMYLLSQKDQIQWRKNFREKLIILKKTEVRNLLHSLKRKTLGVLKIKYWTRNQMFLFERTRTEGLITGFTSNYIRVEYPWQFKTGRLCKKVKLKNIAPTGRMSVELID